MNTRGPCSGCGAPLDIEQRYCVQCGQRVGPPLALPYLTPPGTELPGGGKVWGLALPMPLQMATTFAAMALGFGVVVGTAISPEVSDLVAAGPSVVAQAPAPEPSSPEPAPASGGSSGGGSSPTSSPSASFASTPTSSGGGGGGKHKKKKKKKKPAPDTVTLSGTVVRVNPVAVSYALASGGSLTAVHAIDPGALPQVGDVVSAQGRKLKNGTYAEEGGRAQQGTADSATFNGTVTFCADVSAPGTVQCDGNPLPPLNANDQFVYAVSSVGSSVLVRSPRPVTAPAPAVGSAVSVGVHLAVYTPVNAVPRGGANACDGDGEPTGLPSPPVVPTKGLEQTSINTTGPPNPTADLEAVVQAVCTGSGQLVLSGDDVREAGLDLLPPLAADPSLLGRINPGEAVYANVGIGGGTPPQLTLRGITSDQGTGGADDPAQGQGTLAGQ